MCEFYLAKVKVFLVYCQLVYIINFNKSVGEFNMNKDKNRDNPWRAMAVVGAIGVDFAVLVIIGVFVGNKLDQSFQTAPVFLLIGIAIGIILGIFSIIKLIKFFLED